MSRNKNSAFDFQNEVNVNNSMPRASLPNIIYVATLEILPLNILGHVCSGIAGGIVALILIASVWRYELV